MGPAFRLAVALLPLLYFVLAAEGAVRAALASPQRHQRRRVLAGLAVLLHAGLFFAIHHETHAFPLVIPGAALSALALALFRVYSGVEWSTGVRSLSVFVLGAVFVIQLAARAIGFTPGGKAPVATPLFIIHVVTIIASVATLLLSGFFGMVYLVVEREMRSQKFGPLFASLPKLSELASMNRRAAAIGFVLMTIGLNLGIWQAHATARQGFAYTDPMVVITMTAWIVFGLIALSRWVRFLSGRKAAVTAVFGLVMLVGTIVVASVPGLSFHHFS
jgi:ABC-type uncharacterized transport system permease subunit